MMFRKKQTGDGITIYGFPSPAIKSVYYLGILFYR